jgi:hypothetical protein
MAEDKKAISIDKDDVGRAKAMLEVFEKMEEVIDRTRGITKQKQKITEQEIKDNQKILDLTKSIEAKKQKAVELEREITKESGTYNKMQAAIKKHEDELVLSLDRHSKIQQNIADNEYKLQASNERTGIIKDQIKYQQTLLAQKEKQYQLEIASGKITDRTRAARVREMGAIKDIIKAKEQEGKKEEYINSMLVKKVAGGLDAAKREEALQGVLNKQIATRMIEANQQKILVDKLKYKQNLNRLSIADDEKELANLKNKKAEQERINLLKENLLKTGKLFEETLVNESEGYKKTKELVTDIAKGGFGAWLAVIKASIDRWKELDKAALKFRETTGFIVSQTKEIDKAAREVNTQMANLGVTIDKAYEAAAALTEEFQVIGLVTKEAIANTAMMAANIGVNVKDAAKFKGLFESISESAGSSGDSMIKSAAALAEMGGVAPKAVLNDMANASAETLTFLAKSPMALMRATVEARRLGTTVNSLSKSARGFLNYQDSITSELEASALVGKSLNFQEARAAAYAGDVVKARELALKQIEKAGDFTKLNVYQQEALAKAAGMTTDEVIKQQNQQKLLAKLEQTKPELYKKYMAMQEKMKENERAAREDLEKQAEEMAKRELMQGELNKLTNAFDAIWTDISDSLLAIANNIMPPIIVAARLLGGIFKIIGAVIRGFLTPFDRIGSSLRSGTDGGLMLEKVMTAILEGVQIAVPYVEKLAEVAGYAVNAFAFLAVIIGKGAAGAKPFLKIASVFGSIANAITNFASGLSGISQVFSPILKGFASIARFAGTFARFLGPIGLIISAVQVLWEFGKSLIEIWSSDDMDPFQKIIASLVAIPKAIWNALVQPIIDGVAWILNKIWPGMGDGLIDGIKSVGTMLYDTLIQPFVDIYDWIKEKLMGSSPSEIGLGIVDGIKSIGGMLLDALTWPFRTVVNFISGIFGGDGTLGTMIVDSVKNIAGTVFDFLVSPFKSAFNFIKKIPLVGKLFGGGDAAATVNNEVKSTVENQVAMAVEVKNINELKETVDKLTEAIAKLGGAAGAAAPVVNVNNNQTAMIEKLDELIGLLSSGAIAVNMDGILVSKTLAKTS